MSSLMQPVKIIAATVKSRIAGSRCADMLSNVYTESEIDVKQIELEVGAAAEA